MAGSERDDRRWGGGIDGAERFVMRGVLGRRFESGRRGQILVVGGLLLATSFVVLAVVLNAGIYVDHVSSRGATSTTDVMDARQEAVALVNDSLTDANALHDDDHETLARNLTRRVGERERLLASRRAKTGASARVTVEALTNRTEIAQTNESLDFTDATGETNWTLGREVTGLRDFHVRVHTDQLRDSGEGTPFTVRLDDGSTRSVAVRNNTAGDGIEVTITDSDGSTSTCERTGAAVWMNVTDGTVGGSSCTGLEGAVAIDGPTTVQYRNAGHVRGRYAVTVLSTRSANTTHFRPGPTTPNASFAIESVEASFAFRSSDVRYAARIAVDGA